jgi:HEAT repeat protein
MRGGDEFAETHRGDPRSTEDLIHLALTKDADKDHNDYWDPVWALQSRLPGILERIKKLGDHPDEKSRATAATLLGQNGLKDKVAVSECATYPLEMLKRETSPVVLTSLAFAHGHLHDPACIETLLPLKHHASADVRYALVHSLSGHDDERAIKTLIDLSADVECDVRDAP